MVWYVKAGLLFFSAFIAVPWLYSQLFPNELSIKEGNYPVKKTDISTEFGEFDSGDLPSADMPMFDGPSMSTAGRYLDMEIQKEWLHPDVIRRRKLLQERAKKYQDTEPETE